jgi:hypothetical protein
MHSACPVHLILLELITLTVLGEEYKLLNMHLHPYEYIEINMTVLM